MPPATNHCSPDALVPLEGLDRTQIAVAGGKGAQLGELTWIDGVSVPAGFVVTTAAYRRATEHASRLDPGASVVVPGDVGETIRRAVAAFAAGTAFAVRSSATTEDQPSASSAGLHDTFLGVVGADAVVDAVGRCWASLFTDRAMAYRMRNGIDDGHVAMAVVVQEMVAADVSGVVFTADPVTSNRTVALVEAVPGLGDSLVSGAANADRFRVRDGVVVETSIADAGPSLTEDEVLELVELGRRIETHMGCPQDIEWCLTGGRFWIVQSRPITTLFPVPTTRSGREGNRVYLSVGHQQMMTDAMKPLGLSLHQRVAVADMHEAGGRLFVDVTDRLASPAARDALLALFGRSDPLTSDAVRTLIDRSGFLPPPPDDVPRASALVRATEANPEPLAADPRIPARLVERDLASIAAVQRAITFRSGADLFEFIDADIAELKLLLVDADTMRALMAGIDSAAWLNAHVEEWLGDKNVADTLTLSVPDNITSEMGLDLLDVADVIRPYPDVVAFLEGVDAGLIDGSHLLDDITALAGGPAARAAIVAYLDRYGMRGAGEIDITRPRWAERPDLLVGLILGNVKNTTHGERARRFEAGRRAAAGMEHDVLTRLRTLPDGARKAAEAKAAIDRVRTFAGYREFPKYAMICRYFAYKQALVAEAERLVAAGVLADREDCFFLTFDEFRDTVVDGRVDEALLAARREAHRWHETLSPPRVLTSEGENVTGSYRRDDVPPGTLVGLAVSSGTVEGRARVVATMTDARLEPGDVLVTNHTDPGWSPLFVAAAGLVTEIGGATSHGSVIAREYGLPAVVGVTDATTLIADGQRIRVHGTDGYVELLAE